MKFISKILMSTLAVLVASWWLNGVQLEGNHPVLIAILVALVIGFLNAVVKPILVFLTLPVSYFTLGLFLLVINTALILLAGKIVPEFQVDGFWSAFWFSIIVSFFTSVFEGIQKRDEEKHSKPQ